MPVELLPALQHQPGLASAWIRENLRVLSTSTPAPIAHSFNQPKNRGDDVGYADRGDDSGSHSVVAVQRELLFYAHYPVATGQESSRARDLGRLS